MRRLTEPRRPQEEHLRIVRGVARDVRPDDEELSDWYAAYTHFHARRIAHDLGQVLDRVPRDRPVLEIGAIPLMLTGALTRSGYTVEAVDIDPDRFANAIRSLDLSVRRHDIERDPLPFDDGAFGAVLFNELFEHLRIDPVFTVSEARRVLRPDGLLFLSTPNLRSARGLWNLVVHGRAWCCSADPFTEYKRLREVGHMGHVREYTPTEVTGFLEHSGFEVREIIHRGLWDTRGERVLRRSFRRLLPFFGVIASRRELDNESE